MELALKVNQSSARWAPKANPQRGLWVVPKANQPKFGARGGGDGVGIEGKPELCMLGAEGEPTEWTVGDAEGKAAKFGVGGGGG